MLAVFYAMVAAGALLLVVSYLRVAAHPPLLVVFDLRVAAHPPLLVVFDLGVVLRRVLQPTGRKRRRPATAPGRHGAGPPHPRELSPTGQPDLQIPGRL
ncbi:hypothetical protein GCM10009632_27160 [Mycolicibacterium alvei]|uniref:Uncharacterized protein n=1 Tax=Mycolicibacterium alvei TaxID=67081 RepID=A0A6N4UZY0_9MYCO|nr:hypothetical protein MALV_46900 [Mycolicibacterium alvei]